MSLITALCGLKVRVSTLDAFLDANGNSDGTLGGIPPRHINDTADEISALLQTKVRNSGGNSSRTRLVIPYIRGHDRASWAYVAYDYFHIYAQRYTAVDDLPEKSPKGFVELRQEILGYSRSAKQDCAGLGEIRKENKKDDDEGQTGMFIVVTEERSWTPPEPAACVIRLSMNGPGDSTTAVMSIKLMSPTILFPTMPDHSPRRFD
ncbi:hypothetical protein VMCG_05220 [Cytospora schulzeri]|uniref:Uncharacterized protein n=1 Tax=Cytospora schulzeri TaxID=448051 RepID=A0A423WR19_9PEZI|nr:hypothetical protein VMCG_05220 [Valsa malicola]